MEFLIPRDSLTPDAAMLVTLLLVCASPRDIFVRKNNTLFGCQVGIDLIVENASLMNIWKMDTCLTNISFLIKSETSILFLGIKHTFELLFKMQMVLDLVAYVLKDNYGKYINYYQRFIP